MMKNLKLLYIAAAFITFSSVFVSCEPNNVDEDVYIETGSETGNQGDKPHGPK
ncbi:hypothetical protein ACJD0Z_13615 [Flavobacteriaceae bacterium M23B6Z8]